MTDFSCSNLTSPDFRQERLEEGETHPEIGTGVQKSGL